MAPHGITQAMVLSWVAHGALSILCAGLLWIAVRLIQRRLPTVLEAALCTLPPIAWYWSRESTQYERYRHYRAGYVERLLPWNWFPDQLGDILAPVLVLGIFLVLYAHILRGRQP